MIRAALAALLATLALQPASPALAYWTAGGTGAAFGSADTLPAGGRPTASALARAVTVTWTQTLFGGLPLGGYGNGGYSIRRYPAAGGAAVTPGAGCDSTVTGGTATLSCSESNVPPGSWRYTVTPLLGTWTGAESLKSAAVAVAPDGPALSSVTAQNPPAGQATGAIAVSWAAVPGATGYNVYRRTSSGSYDYAAPLNGPAPTSATSYSDPGSGLAGATTYAYVVRAVTSGAESADSNELAATAIARLDPPASVTATPIAAGRISVAWPGVAGAGGYNVYRRLSTGSYDSSPLNGSTPVNATSFTDATAVDGSTYRYVVRSVVTGAGGTPLESLADSPQSAAATSDATPPASVAITDPGSPLRGAITFGATATDAGSGVASVRIQYAPAGTSTWTTACTATTAPYSCSFDTASTADGLHDLRALATDAAGNTTASATVADRRVDNTGPTVTTNDPGAFVRGSITLGAGAADAGSGVASVAIQEAPTGRTTWATVCTDTTSPYSCPLNTTTLTEGGYDLRAIATDVAGNTTTSTTVTNRVVDNTAPSGVDITAANVPGGTIAHPEAGDVIAYTFSEPINPASILAGWTGSATTVTVRFTNGNPDVVTVWDAPDAAQLALGSFTSAKKYVTGNVTFSGSTMVLSASKVAVTLGTPSGSTATPNGSTTLQWTTATAATDRAGNPLLAGTILESGAPDQDF
jgi:hypothetical protein